MSEIDVSAWPMLPLSPADDDEVEAEVARLLTEVVTDTLVEWEEVPGLRKLEGREALAFYEGQPEEWWFDLYATHPTQARHEFQNWARLTAKYRRVDEYGRLVPA